MLADPLGKARVERRELEVGPVLFDQQRQVGHPEESAGLVDDGVARVQLLLDLADEVAGMSGSAPRTTLPRRRRLIAVRK